MPYYSGFRSRGGISRMLEKVAAFLRADLGEERSDRAVEARDGALGGLAQQRFDFAEGFLYRIELRRILRQLHYFRANRFDRFLDAAALVGLEVVQNDGFAAREGWRQTLFDIGDEGRSVHRPINHQRSDHPIKAQTGHQCDRLPIPVRHTADQLLAAWAASPEPNHIGAGRKSNKIRHTDRLRSSLSIGGIRFTARSCACVADRDVEGRRRSMSRFAPEYRASC